MADGVRASMKTDSLIRKFRALVPASEAELVAAAMKGAEEVAALARRFTRSTRTRATIKTEPAPEKLGALVIAGGEGDAVELRKGSGQKVSLARLEQFGVKPHTLGGKFAGAKHPGIRPNQFLFTASRLNKKTNTRRMGAALGKAARRIATA